MSHTQEGLPPALIHALEAELDTIARLITVFFVLSGVSIALRIYVRAQLLKYFGANDWVMIVAYVGATRGRDRLLDRD